jgi:hypothetical protein
MMRRVLVVGLSALALILIGAALCGGASAATLKPGSEWFQELPAKNREGVTDFLYEQSPESTIPDTGEPSEISSQVSSDYESVAESDPGYEDIAGDLADVEENAGLIPEVSAALPTLAAAGTAFLAGWEIGEGINAIFADIGLGEGSAPELTEERGWHVCYSEACGGSLAYKPFGTKIIDESTTQQRPGTYVYEGRLYQGRAKNNYLSPVHWFESPCEFSGVAPPPHALMETGVNTGGRCAPIGGGKPVNTYVEYPYVPPSKLVSQQTLHPYDPLVDGTPTVHSKAPPDPGTTAVETGAEQYFDANEQAQEWLDSEMEPQEFPSPFVTKTKENHDCDRSSGPTYENLEGNNSPEPFAKKEEAPFTVTTTPEGVAPESVYLRWGETDWLPGRETFKGEAFRDLWSGWGYRHILAKHGWSALDREETEAALVDDLTPLKEPNGLWKYETFDPTAGLEGTECVRTVLVDFEKGERHGVPDPAPRGIVTSYNQVVP